MVRAVASDRFAAGARIGDYQVDGEVAIDATAVVYLATHVVLPRRTYIKVPHPGSRVAAIQVLREAYILEALSHAGIPRVYECGVLADGRPWCAIEVMGGVTLKQLTSDGPLAPTDLVVALRDVTDILRHSHERGVVHCRLTADAIVRTQHRRRSYAICEWSDARTLDAEDGAAVAPKDDVHALGMLAFRALTGHSPESTLVSAGTLCPSAPAELIALIDQMRADPAERPTAYEVYERAHALCTTLGVGPLIERPRWTPPQGYVGEGGPASRTDDDQSGLTVPISRMRSR